jgi:hypothetical protein
MTGRTSSSQEADIPVGSPDVVVLAVAQWVWIGLIFAVVAVGVVALARRA